MRSDYDSEFDALLRRCSDLIGTEDPAAEPEYRPEDCEEPRSVPEEQAAPSQKPTTAARRTQKKKHGCLFRLLGLLTVLLVLLGIGAYMLRHSAVHVLSLVGAAESPAQSVGGQSPDGYTRLDGVCTILLAGTDGDGLRTDTIVLFRLNAQTGEMGLLSIPRDTLVYGGYSVAKINSAYGWAGCGDAGMQELMDRVQEIIGYRPDGYVCIDMQTLVDAVDCMGGISYDVPIDMTYSDPWQNLSIDLKAGTQQLNGQQALGLLRFRSGYATADLQRVQVQRDFIRSALRQWVNIKNLPKLCSSARLVLTRSLTDLDLDNLLWMAGALLQNGTEGECITETLPGQAAWISGGSYYVLDPGAVADLINTRFNIYDRDLTPELFSIRTG